MRIIWLLVLALVVGTPAWSGACDTWESPDFWLRSNEMVARQCLTEDGFLELRNADGETPLHRVAEFADYPEAIAGFAGATLDFNALNNRGLSSLHLLAKRAGPSGYIQMLVAAGADVNLRTPRGDTALTLLLLARGSGPKVDVLLRLGADPRVETNGGATPLIIAVMTSAGVTSLIEAGADPNRKTQRGLTAMMAMMLSRQPILTIVPLLQAGGDPNAVDPLGYRLIDRALQFPQANYAILGILANFGANLNAQDAVSRRTLLHKLAILPRQEAPIRALIGLGADVNIRDKNGDTPKDLMERFGTNSSIIPELEMAN